MKDIPKGKPHHDDSTQATGYTKHWNPTRSTGVSPNSERAKGGKNPKNRR